MADGFVEGRFESNTGFEVEFRPSRDRMSREVYGRSQGQARPEVASSRRQWRASPYLRDGIPEPVLNDLARRQASGTTWVERRDSSGRTYYELVEQPGYLQSNSPNKIDPRRARPYVTDGWSDQYVQRNRQDMNERTARERLARRNLSPVDDRLLPVRRPYSMQYEPVLRRPSEGSGIPRTMENTRPVVQNIDRLETIPSGSRSIFASGFVNPIRHLERAQQSIGRGDLVAAVEEFKNAIRAADSIDRRELVLEWQKVRRKLDTSARTMSGQERRQLAQYEAFLEDMYRSSGYARANLGLFLITRGYGAEGVQFLLDASAADPKMRSDRNFQRHLMKVMGSSGRVFFPVPDRQPNPTPSAQPRLPVGPESANKTLDLQPDPQKQFVFRFPDIKIDSQAGGKPKSNRNARPEPEKTVNKDRESENKQGQAVIENGVPVWKPKQQRQSPFGEGFTTDSIISKTLPGKKAVEVDPASRDHIKNLLNPGDGGSGNRAEAPGKSSGKGDQPGGRRAESPGDTNVQKPGDSGLRSDPRLSPPEAAGIVKARDPASTWDQTDAIVLKSLGRPVEMPFVPGLLGGEATENFIGPPLFYRKALLGGGTSLIAGWLTRGGTAAPWTVLRSNASSLHYVLSGGTKDFFRRTASSGGLKGRLSAGTNNFFKGFAVAGGAQILDDYMSRTLYGQSHGLHKLHFTATTLPIAVLGPKTVGGKLAASAASLASGPVIDYLMPDNLKKEYSYLFQPNDVEAIAMGIAVLLPVTRKYATAARLGWLAAAWSLGRIANLFSDSRTGREDREDALAFVYDDLEERSSASMNKALDQLNKLGERGAPGLVAVNHEGHKWYVSGEADALSWHRRTALLLTAGAEVTLSRGTELPKPAEEPWFAFNLFGELGPAFVFEKHDIDLGGKAALKLETAKNSVEEAMKRTEALAGSKVAINGTVVRTEEMAGLKELDARIAEGLNRVYGKHDIPAIIDEATELFGLKHDDLIRLRKEIQKKFNAFVREHPRFAAKMARDLAILDLARIKVKLKAGNGYDAEVLFYGNDLTRSQVGYDGVFDLIQLSIKLDPENPDNAQLREAAQAMVGQLDAAKKAQATNPKMNPFQVEH